MMCTTDKHWNLKLIWYTFLYIIIIKHSNLNTAFMYIFNSLMQGDDSNPPYTGYMQELRLFKALREIESVPLHFCHS